MQGPSRAKLNWSKLRAIVSQSGRFKPKKNLFSLLKKQIYNDKEEIVTIYQQGQLILKQHSPAPNLKELVQSQDATGKYVWQCQEITAYYIIKNHKEVLNSLPQNQEIRVLELGAGSSGLASITLLKISIKPITITLTDGQQDNIPFLHCNLAVNNVQDRGKGLLLRWGDPKDLSVHQEHSYQLIILCDCLFFKQFHKELLDTIDYCLTEKGRVLMVNPSRGNSQQLFRKAALQKGFRIQQIIFKDDRFEQQLKNAQKHPEFIADRHQPHFFWLQRAQH